MQYPNIPYITPDKPPNKDGPEKKYWAKLALIDVKTINTMNKKCPSYVSILGPSTYIHKQLKDKWAKEKWINIGVNNLHHSWLFVNVSLKDRNIGLPVAIVGDKLNFKKVRGSITEMMLPKFETIAITTDIRIIGM